MKEDDDSSTSSSSSSSSEISLSFDDEFYFETTNNEKDQLTTNEVVNNNSTLINNPHHSLRNGNNVKQQQEEEEELLQCGIRQEVAVDNSTTIKDKDNKNNNSKKNAHQKKTPIGSGTTKKGTHTSDDNIPTLKATRTDTGTAGTSTSRKRNCTKKTTKKQKEAAVTTTATTTAKVEMKMNNKRPKQPPNPPKSLIKLIQNDKLVLKYFQSLQENLQADVTVWKQRATAYQQDTIQLQQQLDQLQRSVNVTNNTNDNEPTLTTTTKRKRKNCKLDAKDTKLIQKISKNTLSPNNNQDECNIDDDDNFDNDSNDKELCTTVARKGDHNKNDNKDSTTNNFHVTHWNPTNQPVDDTLFDDMSSSESDNDNDNIIPSKEILPKQQQQETTTISAAAVGTRPSLDDPEKNNTSSLIHESDFDFDDNDDDADDESKQSSNDDEYDSSSKQKCKVSSNDVIQSKKKPKNQKQNGFLNFSSSSSSDDDNNADDSDEENDVSSAMDAMTNKTFVVPSSGALKQHDENNTETKLIYSILVQTYETLMGLGITLVTTNNSTASTSNGSNSARVNTVASSPNHDIKGKREDSNIEERNNEDNIATTVLQNDNRSKNYQNSTNVHLVGGNDDDDIDNDDDSIFSKQQNSHQTPGTGKILRNGDEDIAAQILHYVHSEFLSAQKQRNQQKVIVATNSNNVDDDNDMSNVVDADAAVHTKKEEREFCNSSLFTNVNLIPFYFPRSDVESDVSTSNGASDDSIHPIMLKMRILFNVLTSFETLCSPLIPQDEWKSYFNVSNYEKTIDSSMQDALLDTNKDNDYDRVDDANEKQKKNSSVTSKDDIYSMTVGLRGRHTLVVQLIKSLEGELIEGWACTDRALHFTAAESAITDTDTIQHDDYYDTVNDQDDSLLEKDTNDRIVEKDRDEMYVGETKNKIDVMCVTVKSQTRIAALFERCTLSQLIIGMILNRNQTCYAFYVLLSYIHSTVPATKIEQSSSNWPPVCSLLIVEAMIRVEYTFPNRSSREQYEEEFNNNGITWFQSYLETEMCGHRREWVLLFMKNTFEIVANTFQKRKQSSIEHIRDVAFIELACYERLVAMFQSLYTKYSTGIVHDEFIDRIIPLILLQGHSIDDEHKGHHEESQNEHEINCTVLAQSGLVLLYSNITQMQTFFHDIISKVLDADSEYSLEQYKTLLSLIPVAIRQVGLRQMDQLRHNTFLRLTCHIPIPITDLWSFGSVVSTLSRKIASRKLMNLFPYIVKLLLSIANAEYVFESVSVVVESFEVFDESAKNEVYQLFQETTSIPVVRVINLLKRQDRFAAFVAQAIREKFTIVKAVTPFRDDIDEEIVHDYNQPKVSTNVIEWGCHAFDGTLERLTDAYDYLENLVGSQEILNSLVLPHWCPNNIRAFDTNAPSSPHFVRTTPTEVACALSHLSSWKGVVQSLSPLQRRNNNHVWTKKSREQDDCVKTALNRLVLLRKISGFAQGPAVLEKNRNMSPTPVCIILEDDAIVCDDFNNRLDSLLKELPRDFHFCSLGYSRPKTAPIVPYSTEIGIPTMLWYLTGYVLSYDGAKYLLDSLPIEGPVDTFIGLKMTNNWDNSYGVALGVGNRVNPVSELPSRKHLADILQFRAFCAMNPLCTQKAPSSIFNKANDRSWRKRDTDIEYSGYSAPIHRPKK